MSAPLKRHNLLKAAFTEAAFFFRQKRNKKYKKSFLLSQDI
tara:strand:+ start:439 stop:561 length:123 start_codon:yes stop_codon:yes gene_type:complete